MNDDGLHNILYKERQKLQRQEQAVSATKALIEMLEQRIKEQNDANASKRSAAASK